MDLPTSLQQQLQPRQNNIIEIDAGLEKVQAYHQIPATTENVEALAEPFVFEKQEGIKVGEHQGAQFYTVGQRKGLHIGDRLNPSFVLQIDTKNNLIFSGQLGNHPALNCYALKITELDIHFVNPDAVLKVGDNRSVMVCIRYRQPLKMRHLFESRMAYIFFL